MNEQNRQGFRLILASGSPRRRELLSKMGYEFEVLVTDVDEHVAGPAREVVGILSRRKADAAAARLEDGIVIASDTLVSMNGDVLGKPEDEDDAHRMLCELSGRTHQVYTGVTLADAADGRRLSRVVCTHVTFRELTEEEIWDYIRSGEPMDKAGAYGIQGGAGRFVAALDGSYENVIGFPVADIEEMLREFIKK